MDITLTAVRQTVIMFLYMLMGAVLYKSGKLTKNGSKDLAALLLWLILPAVIVDSFCVPFDHDKMMEMIISFLLGIAALILAMAVSAAVFHKRPIDNFAAAFSNAGFMGIPLVREVFGEEAVFCTVGFIAALNILQWTYGVAVLTGEKKHVSTKSIILNPIFISAVAGILLFSFGAGGKIPPVLDSAFDGVAALNGPVAMLVLGCYLAQTKPWKMLIMPSLYRVSLVRLIVIPLLTALLFRILPGPALIKGALLCVAAAPVGANVAVYAQLHDLDYPYACQMVVFSTIWSVLSLPLMIALTGVFF